jgi:hypothetical protein
MALLVLTETDTDADNGTNVGCSGATGGATLIAKEATDGGTAGITQVGPNLGVRELLRAVLMFQSDSDEPGETTWDSGDYVVRVNITQARAGLEWRETYICERTTGGSFNTVASLTGQTTDCSTTGTKTHTVNRATDYSAASSSTLYIVCVFFMTLPHGTTNFGVTPDQNINTPIDIAAGATLTATLEAAIKDEFTKTANLNAAIKDQFLLTTALNAGLSKESTLTTNLEGVVQKTFTLQTNLESAIQQIDNLLTSNLNSAIERVGGTRQANATRFDGTDNYLNRGAGLTGAADGKKGTLSCWVKLNNDSKSQRIIAANTLTDFYLMIDSGNKIDFVAGGPGGDAINLASGGTITADASFHHILISWDVENNKAHLYIDDVSDNPFPFIDNQTIDYTQTDWFIGTRSTLTEKLDGCLSEFYFNSADYIDLSVTANRRRFVTADVKPFSLGSDGSKPTGNAPIVYLPNPFDSFWINAGTGGDFIENGSPSMIACANSPDSAFDLLSAELEGVLQSLKTLTATLNSVIQATIEKQTSLNGAIQLESLLTASLNALIALTKTVSTSLNGVVQKLETQTTSLNAAISQLQTISSTLNAGVSKEFTEQASLEAAVQIEQLLTASLNASLTIEGGVAITTSLNAAIQKLVTAQASLSGVISDEFILTTTLNAALAVEQTLQASLNAVAQAQILVTASLDASLTTPGAQTVTTSLNAAIQKLITTATSLNAAISDVKTTTTGLNSAISELQTISTNLDAVLQFSNQLNVLMNAAVIDIFLSQVSIDAALEKEITLQSSMNAGLAFINELTSALSAFISGAQVIVVSLDSAVQSEFIINSLLDAVIGEFITIDPKRTFKVEPRDSVYTVPRRRTFTVN